MNDPLIYCYLSFLNYILSHISKFNKVFQRETPTIHLIHDSIVELYKFLLCTFSHKHFIATLSLHEIDPAIKSLHKPLNQLYLGSDLHEIYQKPEYHNQETMIQDIRRRCKTFLLVLCQEIRKRFKLDNNLWKLAAYLHPRRVMSSAARAKMPSLRDFITSVPRLDPVDKQTIDDQWRNIPWHTFPEEFTSPACNVTKFYEYV